MPSIHVSQSGSAKLTRQWDYIQSIEIESKPFAEGAFGEIYDCRSVNGSPVASPLVIKIFKQDGQGNDQRGYQTICKLQERVAKKNEELLRSGKKSLATIPGLYALPQFSFEGQLNNKRVLGSVDISHR